MIAIGSSIFAFGQLWTRYRQAHAEGAAYYEFFWMPGCMALPVTG